MSSLSEGRLRKKALGACRKIDLMMGVGVIGLTMKGDGGGGGLGRWGHSFTSLSQKLGL